MTVFLKVYSYFKHRYKDRHGKRYFFGNGKYAVTVTVSTARIKLTFNVTFNVGYVVTLKETVKITLKLTFKVTVKEMRYA